jgi:CO/xanthine dehydrogenase Mo-binding subunit
MQTQTVATEEHVWVGKPITRLDAHEKVTGRAVYANDFKLPNMLYAKIKRSTEPHARIKSIDSSKAREMKGVVSIVDASDFKYVYNPENPPPIAVDEVRFVGEPVAAVAAEDEDTAKAAIDEINVDYESMPFTVSAEEAMSEKSQVIVHKTELGKNVAGHVRVRVGNVEAGFKESDFIVENTYTTQMVQHLPLGPLTVVAEYRHDSGVNVYIGSQNANDVHAGITGLLGLDSSSVRVIEMPYVGGWFGMKGDLEVAAVCAKLSIKAKRHVKLQLTREELFSAVAVRHPSKITIKDGVSKDGRLLARKMKVIFDGGAYARRSNILLKNSIYASTPIYRFRNFELDTYRAYTNHVPSQNMRAPYGPQMYFAIESQMDMIARKLGIDPIELRKKNILREGEKSVIGEKIFSAGYEDCLNAVNAKLARRVSVDRTWRYGVGIAVATKWSPANSPFAAIARLKSDGKVEISTSLVDVGEGIYTGIAQIAAEALKQDLDKIIVLSSVYGADSSLELPGTGPSGSRQLYNCGNAVILACKDLRKRILELVASRKRIPVETLDLDDGNVVRAGTNEVVTRFPELFDAVPHAGKFVDGEAVLMGKGIWYERVPGIRDEDGMSQADRVVAFYTPAVTGAEVKINTETGEMIVEKLVTAVDVGKAINPSLVEGQIIGAGMMGLGFAVSEELQLSKDDGWILNPNLSDYKPPYPADSPEFVPIIVEHPQFSGPFGAKGTGEAPILAVAPAIANAVHDALNVRITDLPLTNEKILMSLKNSKSAIAQ